MKFGTWLKWDDGNVVGRHLLEATAQSFSLPWPDTWIHCDVYRALECHVTIQKQASGSFVTKGCRRLRVAPWDPLKYRCNRADQANAFNLLLSSFVESSQRKAYNHQGIVHQPLCHTTWCMKQPWWPRWAAAPTTPSPQPSSMPNGLPGLPWYGRTLFSTSRPLSLTLWSLWYYVIKSDRSREICFISI